MTQPGKIAKQLRFLWRYSTKTALILVAILGFAARYTCAQQLNCAPWNQDPQFSGSITLNGSGTSTQTGESITIDESVTFTFHGNASSLACSSFIVWGDQYNVDTVTYSINDTVTDPCPGGGSQSTVSQGSGAVPIPALNYLYIALAAGGGAFNFQANTYSVAINTTALPGQETATGCDGSQTVLPGPIAFGPRVNFWVYNVPLPSVPTLVPLSGSAPITDPNAFPGAGVTWTASWNIAPVPPDVDVIVTIPTYDTWRPNAGKNETDPGSNTLTIQAQLVNRGTNQLATVVPDKWSISLIASSEPGVAMNWPSMTDRANPSPPDMTFDKTVNSFFNPNLTISNKDLLAEIANPGQTASPQNADVILVPFDWGGWATLNVTATVFGTPFQGHFQGDSNTNVLLPKRQPGSNIADIWKSQNNVAMSTPDSDDSEVDPQGRSDCVGDGFTLYEEYRGFMENGKHIEGDPNNKDFFILNEIGADAEPGIFQFTSLTGLTVHKDIQENEVEMTDRPVAAQLGVGPINGNPLINFNVGQGAFEGPQHGVVLLTCDIDGGQAVWPNAGPTNGHQIFGPHAQPGTTDFICMQERDAPGTLNPSTTHIGITGTTGSITPQNAIQQYDVGVAHELLHSVGVLHHGDRSDEGKYTFTLLFPTDPRNTTGQPLFQLAGQNVLILDEQTGQDEAANLWNWILAQAQQCDNLNANPGAFPPSVADLCDTFKTALTDPLTGQLSTFWNNTLWVGEPEGKPSGDDQCVMRYPFANAYPSIAGVVGPPIFYTVPDGSEPLGQTLCSSPAGTGINDPAHLPQPRYFDARSGRGACKTWICVNDVYPPAADSQ